MSLYIVEKFENPTEEAIFNLSAGMLRFEYLIILLGGLILVTLLINFLIFRKRKPKSEQFKVKSIDDKPQTKLQIFFTKTFLPALSFVGRGSLYFWNVLLLSALGGAIYYMFFLPPWIIRTTPQVNNYWTDFRKPVSVEFSNPVNADKLKMHMSPAVPGKWEKEKIVDFLPFVRKVTFVPDESLFSDQHVVIYFTGISGLAQQGQGYETDYEFDIPELPKVESVEPAMNVDKVQTDAKLVLKLDKEGKENAKWEIEMQPAVAYKVVEDDSQDLAIAFDESLAQSTTYSVKFFMIPIRYEVGTKKIIEEMERVQVAETAFTTVKTPGVSSYEPKGKGIFVENQTIKVVFDQEMIREGVEAALSITPETQGTVSWVDDKTFLFKPQGNLAKATHYDIVFAKGMQSKFEGKTETDVKVGFDTIGAVTVSGNTPGNGYKSVSTGSNVQITFNQEVNHASAQSKFKISPNVAGTFSWSGNTLIFNPGGSLAYQTKYTVTINSGVKTVRGLDSNKSYSFSFTTVPEKYLISGIPWYKQQESFTCNIAATRMALAYRGVYRSESAIKSGVGIQPSKSAGGNPYSGWVNGYGVYWGPVSSYVSNYRSNAIKSGWNLSGLAHEIQKGNPVILWWHNQWSDPYWMTWTTTSGSTVKGLNGMHSEVAYGFKGSPDNPSYIYTKDPWRGNRVYSASYFNSLWGYFGKTGIVVY